VEKQKQSKMNSVCAHGAKKLYIAARIAKLRIGKQEDTELYVALEPTSTHDELVKLQVNSFGHKTTHMPPLFSLCPH
jgi:hypothetical protein